MLLLQYLIVKFKANLSSSAHCIRIDSIKWNMSDLLASKAFFYMTLKHICICRGRQAMLDVTAGLFFLHSRKLSHNDLKTPNVLIGGDMRVKIADLGELNYLLHRMPLSIGFLYLPVFFVCNLVQGHPLWVAISSGINCDILAWLFTEWAHMWDCLHSSWHCPASCQEDISGRHLKEVYLAGLGKLVNGINTQVSQFGTFAYLSPEFLTHGVCGLPSDIWAFSTILIEVEHCHPS